MNVRATVILLFLFVLIPAALHSQQTRQVRGRILSLSKDSEPAEALSYASIVILCKADSSFVKGVTSDVKGYFRIRFSPSKQEEYMLKASYMGFTPAYYSLNFKDAILNLGDLLLKEEDIELDEVTITANASEIRQVGDTTVINVAAYKTPEGAYLEELVKRIPGLDYDMQTKELTYNGLKISEINVNGESFFPDNFAIALENLPADLISHIKVYDKKSELEKVTGVRSGRENYVLDLQTKKEFNGTLMSSAKVGFGNERKKDYELQMNYFKNGGDNFSLIGRSTNLDMNSAYKGNIHHGLGTNFAKRFRETLMLNGNISYNGGKMGNRSTGYNEEYLSGGNQYKYSANENINKNDMVNGALGMRWEINKQTFLNLSGRMSIYEFKNSGSNRQATFNDNPGLNPQDPFTGIENVADEMRVNDIVMDMLSTNKHSNYNLDADMTRILNKKGSSISLITRYSQADGKDKGFTLSSTTYYQLKDAHGNDSILYRNRYQSGPTNDRNGGVGMMFTHPFTKEFRLQFSYTFNYNKQNSDKGTYDLSRFMDDSGDLTGHLPEGYEVGFVDSLSNRSRSRTLRHDAVLRLNYSDSIWNVIAEMSMQPERRTLDQKTGLLHADTTTKSVGFHPNFLINWRKGDNQVNLSYQGHTRQPSITDLLALTDNRDPLNITRGNPHLKPAFNQSLRFDIQNHKKGLSANFVWRQERNSHTSAMSYNKQTGGREIYPVNVNGNWSIDGALRYQKRIRDFRISVDVAGEYDQDISLINEKQSEQPERTKTRSDGFNNNVRVSYLPEWGGIDFSGDWRYRHSNNSLRKADTYTRDYNLWLTAYANVPGNVHLKTEGKYSFRNGTNIEKGKDDQFVWNAEVTWRFLKKKQAEVSVLWADILSQQKTYFRHMSANGLSETHLRQTGGYFIVSVRYRFNKELK